MHVHTIDDNAVQITGEKPFLASMRRHVKSLPQGLFFVAGLHNFIRGRLISRYHIVLKRPLAFNVSCTQSNKESVAKREIKSFLNLLCLNKVVKLNFPHKNCTWSPCAFLLQMTLWVKCIADFLWFGVQRLLLLLMSYYEKEINLELWNTSIRKAQWRKRYSNNCHEK